VAKPELVIIGGGVTQAGDLIFEPLKKAVQKSGLHLSNWTHLGEK